MVIITSVMLVQWCMQHNVKACNQHKDDSRPDGVRRVYVKLQQLRETYSVNGETVANASVPPHV